MSGLLGALAVSTRGMAAQQVGLEVTGQNIANVNTPGYTRRVVDFRDGSPTDGGAVAIHGIRAIRDRLLEQRLTAEKSSEQRQAALTDTLGQVEGVIGLPGQSIDAEMDRFFDAYARLAEEPTSGPLRQQVIQEGTALGQAFATLAQRLADIQQVTNHRVREEVAEINELTAQLAALNQDMASTAGGEEPHDMRDDALHAINNLSEHLDITVLEHEDSRGFDVYAVGGRPLVVSTNAYALSTTVSGTTGFADVLYAGTSIADQVEGGRLGGYLSTRDTLIPAYVDALDELAYSIVAQVNTAHGAGYDLSGADAGNFFTALSAQAGASSSMVVDPTLAADPGLVAAAGTPAAGDNQTARTLASLRDALVLDSNTATFNGFWANLTFQVGLDLRTATEGYESRADAVRQVENLREMVSGVSLTEEALNLMQFQRAYEANAKMFATIDDMLDILMRMVRA